MTIINSFIQNDRAYLATDMAFFDQSTGRVLACGSKFTVGQNFPWCAAVTGDAYIHELANQINWRAPASAEEFGEALPLLLRGLQGLSLDPDFTMAVRLAAWCSRTERARVFHVDTDAKRAAKFGIEAWAVAEPLVLVAGDEIHEALPDIDFTDPASLMDPAKFDPHRDGLRVVAAQRERVRFPLKGQTTPMALIGGGAQLACVTRDGVTVETLHTWPEDRPGALIEPLVPA